MAFALEEVESEEIERRRLESLGKDLRAGCAEETCEPCLTTKFSTNSSEDQSRVVKQIVRQKARRLRGGLGRPSLRNGRQNDPGIRYSRQTMARRTLCRK